MTKNLDNSDDFSPMAFLKAWVASPNPGPFYKTFDELKEELNTVKEK